MAVSYFPTDLSICRSKNKVIIDVSDEDPIEYDELSRDDQTIVYRMYYDDKIVEEQYAPPQP
jgi:hypothetical protein